MQDKNWFFERRSRTRFRLIHEVRYRSQTTAGDSSGEGQTVNISSSGTLFTTDRDLTLGAKVELIISWPMKLDEVVPVNLVVGATIVRVEGRKAAAHFERHEFRLAGRGRKGAA